MFGFLLTLAMVYQLSGRVAPAGSCAITVFGVSSPFMASTLSDAEGRFTFKKLEAGTYTVSVFNPQYGEARRTIEVGPGTADTEHRVAAPLEFQQSDFAFAPTIQNHSVSVRELAISQKARHRWEEARKALSRRDADAAVKNLEEAVEAAPQFTAAWNELGTIAYQRRDYARAEDCFRHALAADPQAFEPLVNLGGVLATVGRAREALNYNTFAVLAHPNDALANSQLGLSYFETKDYDSALKYLEAARKIDPAHFSHPQLVMAEIHARRGDRPAAAADLEDFLQYHPDWPAAAKLRETISQWKK